MSTTETELQQLCRDHLGCAASLAELAASIYDVFATDQTRLRAPEAVTRATLAAWGAPLSPAAWNLLQPVLVEARRFLGCAWDIEDDANGQRSRWQELPRIGEAVVAA